MIKSWKELPIGKYKKIAELENNEDWQWNVLAILNDTTVDDIMSRSLDETMALSRDLNRWIYDKPLIHPVKKKYDIGGKVFEFKGWPKDITTAMYIDFYNMEKEIPKNIADVMSVFLVPDGMKYNDGYDLEEVREWLLNHFSTEDALSVCDFFSALFQRLRTRVLRRAKRALKQARKEGIMPEETEKVINLLKGYLRSSGSK